MDCSGLTWHSMDCFDLTFQEFQGMEGGLVFLTLNSIEGG